MVYWEKLGEVAVDDLLTILVVEDDPFIQLLVEDALTDGGFELAIAVSGEEAVTLLKGNGVKYRVLITDINLRGRLNGWEVAKQAREFVRRLACHGSTFSRVGASGNPGAVQMRFYFPPDT
jgi:CheY-like chemotaxis protein